MKATFFFQIILNLFFAIVLFFVGGCLTMYPFTQDYYHPVHEFIAENTWALPLIGICIM
ncbi:MAG: hypothetical protein JWO53_1196, partial [Chlamydiia bacterium]|nr:hypothetical protein [Chlamydiia bacterium]